MLLIRKLVSIFIGVGFIFLGLNIAAIGASKVNESSMAIQLLGAVMFVFGFILILNNPKKQHQTKKTTNNALAVVKK